MEEIESVENRIELTTESLNTLLLFINNRRSLEIIQICSILKETLAILCLNPTDREYFNVILGIGMEAKNETFNNPDEALLFSYDVFVECATKSLPEDYKREFKSSCARN